MKNELCHKINKSSIMYKRIISKHLESLNITYPQLMVLKVINRESGIKAKEILNYIDSDKATLSGILNRLERDGYIVRKANESDKRIQNIYLGEDAKKLCDMIIRIERDCVANVLDGVSKEDIIIFSNVLDKILINQNKKLGEMNE